MSKCEWCHSECEKLIHNGRNESLGRDYGFCSDKCWIEFLGYKPTPICGGGRNAPYEAGDFDSWGNTVRLYESGGQQ